MWPAAALSTLLAIPLERRGAAGTAQAQPSAMVEPD